MPQTTGPFQFPFWGRPGVINIPGRPVHPFAQLMAGVGEGLRAFAAAKEKKAEWEERKSAREEKKEEAHKARVETAYYKAVLQGRPELEGQVPPQGSIRIGKHILGPKPVMEPKFFDIKGMPGFKVAILGDKMSVVRPQQTKVIESPAEKQRRAKELAQFKHDLSKKLVDYRKQFGTNPDVLNANQRRLLNDSLMETAQKIDLQPTEPAVKSGIAYFNKMSPSDSTTVYVWRKEKKVPWRFGVKTTKQAQAERVELPYSEKLGRKYTIQDVRDIMKANPKDSLETILLNIGAIE